MNAVMLFVIGFGLFAACSLIIDTVCLALIKAHKVKRNYMFWAFVSAGLAGILGGFLALSYT
jgi:hypothetical protein